MSGAILVLGATGTQASAVVWHVGGTDLGKGEAQSLATTAALDSPTIFNFASSNMKIECSGSPTKLSSSQIEGESKLSMKLTFGGCKMLKPAGCSLASEELATSQLEGSLGTSGTKEGFATVGSGTAALVTFSATGAECALAGEHRLPSEESLLVTFPQGQEEASAQPIDSTTSSSYLRWREKAYLEGGRVLLKLASEEKFSAVNTKGWQISGAELAKGSTAALSPNAPLESDAVYNLADLNTKVECTTPLLMTNPYIEGGFKLHASALRLMGCRVLKPADCTLTNEEPSTGAVEGTITIGASPEDRLTLKPLNGEWFTFTASGSECAVAGEHPLLGSIVLGAPTGQEEHVLQPAEGLGTSENNSLEWFDSGSYEGSSFLLKLQSGSKFSIATGPGWHVGGTELPKGSKQTLASTAKIDANTIFHISASPNLKIECKATNLGVESAEVIGIEAAKAQLLNFEGCATIEPKTGCKTGEKIKMAPLSMLMAVGKNLGDTVTLTPNSKKPLLTIPFQETCGTFSGETAVNGSVRLALPLGQVESLAQIFEDRGSTENNSLETGSGNKVYIEGGKTLLSLAGGSKWSFR